jgi:diaminopimelate decarboxylase
MKNNNFRIVKATKNMLPTLIKLSDSTLKSDNDAVYNEEFLCEQGLRSSVAKGYVIVALSDNIVCGMMRFYPNKRAEQLSIYQFAVTESNRGRGVIAKMLEFLHGHYKGAIICKCPTSSKFNDYYVKSGWAMVDYNDYCYWEWKTDG